MKLLYAGFGVTEKPYTDLLFNCTRNAKCERPFYVPVNQFSDISFYTDLEGEPTLIEIEVLNVCEIGNVGSAVSGMYVAGTKPDGNWYGVFGGLVVTPPVGVTYSRFFFRFTITVDGNDHVYYSEQYEFPMCEVLTFLRGCYPNEEVGSDATDCNGIYYGFPNNEDFLGTVNYRYIHSAFLRMASVIEQRNKMTFTAFNNRKVYKGVFNREWLLEFELVPRFFKDLLIGVFNRGNVQLGSVSNYPAGEWKLADSQDISIVDNDSKLWKMDMIFDSECKQTFGCKPADCVLPEAPCVLPALELDFEAVDDHHEGTLTGYSLLPGQSLEWQVIRMPINTVVESGTITTNPLTFITTEDINLETLCYKIRWRLKCSETSFSDWQEETNIGNCVPDPCGDAGFPEGTIYAALFRSAATEDNSADTTCEGNPVHLQIDYRSVFVAFFSDVALTTPILLSLNSFPIVVNGIPYNIGDGSPNYAFFVDFFPWETTQFTGEACLTEVITSPLPTLEANDCFTVSVAAVADGTFTLERGVGDGTTNGYNADMREAVTDIGSFGTPPSAHVAVAAAGPNANSGWPSTSRVTFSIDGGGNPFTGRTFTIVGTATDGTTGETFSDTFALGNVSSTKKYYFDSNHPITCTVDED